MTEANGNGWRNRIVDYGVKRADQFQAHPANWRQHPKHQRAALAASLNGVGWVGVVLENVRTGHLLDGHERLWQALERGDETPVPFIQVDVDEDEEMLVLATLDPIGAMAQTDAEMLESILADLRTSELVQDDAALDALLHSIAAQADVAYGEYTDETPGADEARRTLAERFIVPPFSVLDARQGYWQARKRAWIALGIQSELGRGNENLGMSHPETTATIDFYAQKRDFERELGRDISKDEAADMIALRGRLKNARADNASRIRGKLPADSGGQPLPLDRMGNGKSPARCFGQDLMRGEHVVGKNGKLRSAVYGAAARDDEASRKIMAAAPKRRGETHGNMGAPVGRAEKLTGGTAFDGTWVKKVKGEDFTGLGANSSGTSIFDPVLCELAYRWFCPPQGAVLDPFAGGSVRGIVAARLGRRYVGIDLRAEQVDANREQARAIVNDSDPRWIVGDSRDLDKHLREDEMFDFVFTCPPYFDLEIYSGDPADLSNAGDYAAFMGDYRAIVAASVARLRADRFACVVVGDIRDKRGMYRNFVSDTISAFQSAGAALYNEAILVTSVGSLPIRAGKQFEVARKLGKTHQNVLVFVKGDPRKATEAVGAVEYGDIETANVNEV